MKYLELTLKKKWFDMIASGEKKEEYRGTSPWINARLEGKTYDAVRFRNGYKKDSPVCVCEYKGWHLGFGKPAWGAQPHRLVTVIKLGKVLEKPE